MLHVLYKVLVLVFDSGYEDSLNRDNKGTAFLSKGSTWLVCLINNSNTTKLKSSLVCNHTSYKQNRILTKPNSCSITIYWENNDNSLHIG